MPIYEYACEGNGCTKCQQGLEILQRLSDPPLAQCPDCGAVLVRVISAPQVVAGQAHRLNESHVAKHGFTQYKRAGKGIYEKTAGKGPKYISGD